MRVCGDYKVTLNPCLEVRQYPLLQVEECFQAMNGGKKVIKINLSQAKKKFCLSVDIKDYPRKKYQC